jgi:cell division protein FtsQ
MPRLKRRPLRGSVTQNNAPSVTVRLRAQPTTQRGFMIRLGVLLVGVCAFVGFFAWSWHDGWPSRAVDRAGTSMMNMTQDMHLTVKDITVIGRNETSTDDLNAALKLKAGTAILSFDPDAAQARIAKLPWVSQVTVERHLPDTVVVRIAERAPMARWQHDNKTVVIDNDGKVITSAALEKFSSLPLVVGEEADSTTRVLLNTLQAYPTVRKYMTAASRVGGRRWDLYLQTKTVVKMPEGNMKDALARLTDLIEEKKILERDMVSIDLRLPDRMALEPSPASSAPTSTTVSPKNKHQ